MDTVKGAHRLGRRGGTVTGTRRERNLARVAWSNACAAAALASVFFVGSPGQLAAQSVDQVWGGCKLDAPTVAALKGLISGQTSGSSKLGNPGVSFIVVYTMNDNDGQQLTSGGPPGRFTGPVICINPDAVEGVGIATTTQNATIPAAATGANAVNTLDAEEVFILRYALANGTNSGVVEKIFCHAVNDRTDCFRISPLLPR